MTSSQVFAWLLITVHALLVLFGLVRWRQLDTGCRYTWIWGLFGLITRYLNISLHVPTDRLVVSHFYYPVSAVLATLALAPYQQTRRDADAVRLAGLGYVAVWAIITPLFEDIRTFSVFTAPLRAALIAIIAIRTISVARKRIAHPWYDDRGILIAAAFALLYTATGITSPWAASNHTTNVALIRPLLLWRDVVVLIAMVPMLWAFLLHVPAPEGEQ
ncbi:MAG: hypothetical protein ABIZ70_15990 [Gemmatimonadales bacterium]